MSTPKLTTKLTSGDFRFLAAWVHPPRTDLPLHEQCQLTAQEKILGADCDARAEQQHHPPEGIH